MQFKLSKLGTSEWNILNLFGTFVVLRIYVYDIVKEELLELHEKRYFLGISISGILMALKTNGGGDPTLEMPQLSPRLCSRV